MTEELISPRFCVSSTETQKEKCIYVLVDWVCYTEWERERDEGEGGQMDWGMVGGEKWVAFLRNKNIHLHCLGQPGNPQQQIHRINNPTALHHACVHTHTSTHTHTHTNKVNTHTWQTKQHCQMHSVFRKDINTILLYLYAKCLCKQTCTHTHTHIHRHKHMHTQKHIQPETRWRWISEVRKLRDNLYMTEWCIISHLHDRQMLSSISQTVAWSMTHLIQLHTVWLCTVCKEHKVIYSLRTRTQLEAWCRWINT